MSIYSLTQVFADLFPTFLLIFEEGAQESRARIKEDQSRQSNRATTRTPFNRCASLRVLMFGLR